MPMRVLRTPYIGSAASLVIKPLMFKSLGLENRLLHRYTEAHRRSFSFQFKGISGSVKLARLVRWGTPKDVMTPLSELLPGIQAKTLVVHCSDDLAVTQEMARRTAETIPNASLIILEGPHFIPLTHPELVAEHLLDFFNAPEVKQ